MQPGSVCAKGDEVSERKFVVVEVSNHGREASFHYEDVRSATSCTGAVARLSRRAQRSDPRATETKPSLTVGLLHRIGLTYIISGGDCRGTSWKT